MVAMSRAQEVDLMTKNQTLQQSWSAQLRHVEFQEVCQGFKMLWEFQEQKSPNATTRPPPKKRQGPNKALLKETNG